MSPYRKGAGFSLLEMLVALAVLGIVLGTLYRAATGATRNVAVAEHYSYAVLLAESLLADHGGRARRGYSASGSSGGYEWQVQSSAFAPAADEARALQRVTATVRWEGGGGREVQLATILPVPAQERSP